MRAGRNKMMKLFTLLIAILTFSCAATIPLTEHTKEVNKLNAQCEKKIEAAKCPPLSEKELVYQTRANKEIPAFEKFLKFFTEAFATAISMEYNVTTTVEVGEYAFVDDFGAALCVVKITSPNSEIKGYGLFHQGPIGWYIKNLIYIDIKGEPPGWKETDDEQKL